jgi:hypothetical protein
VDDTATPGTQYCYRVYGYNSAGASGYSNIACGTVQVQTYTVTVAYAGTGTGTVAGGGTYPAGTAVQLTAVPATGSTFGGWSRGGCSGMLTTCTLNLTCSLQIKCHSDGQLYPRPDVDLHGGSSDRWHRDWHRVRWRHVHGRSDRDTDRDARFQVDVRGLVGKHPLRNRRQHTCQVHDACRERELYGDV